MSTQRNLSSSPNWWVLLLIAVFGAGGLAMPAVWLLVAHSPIPDDNAVYLSLFLFVFLLFATVILAVGGVLWSRSLAAVKSAFLVFLLGLAAAAVVGSLPLLWRQAVASAPWMQEVPPGPFFAACLVGYSFYLRKKSTSKGDRRFSRKRLIFGASMLAVMSVFSLLVAVSEFSGGKTWPAAFYLVIGTLFGFVAVDAAVEIWRHREEPRESVS